MPDGATHRLITLIGTATASLALVTIDLPAAGYYAAGGVVGLLVTPDLDIDTKDSMERKLLHDVPVIGAAWYLLWWPYAKMFRHRGVSHWLIIGTLTRLVYLGFFSAFGVLVLRVDVRPDATWIRPAAWGLAGLLVADVFHVVVDGL